MHHGARKKSESGRWVDDRNRSWGIWILILNYWLVLCAFLSTGSSLYLTRLPLSAEVVWNAKELHLNVKYQIPHVLSSHDATDVRQQNFIPKDILNHCFESQSSQFVVSALKTSLTAVLLVNTSTRAERSYVKLADMEYSSSDRAITGRWPCDGALITGT